MGILNVTPDSFYDGGKYRNPKEILSQVAKMQSEGATFIDVGAYSSKPGAAIVTEEEELKRILPIIDLLLAEFPELLLSVDTFRAKVAKLCVSHGAAMINDISAGIQDEKMLTAVAQLRVPYVMMHMRGTPKTMQDKTHYDNLLEDICFYFSERIARATEAGITDILIDPGFGFAKTLEQNFELLKELGYFRILERPILVGLSRKSMIYKTLNTNASGALNGTTALHMYALSQGANILRVHDVKEALDCITLYQALG